MSFKTLCLATMIAASGGAMVTSWVHEQERPLNRYEKIEIEALVFFAAQRNGIDETALRHDTAAKLGLFRLDDLTAADFPTARRYLQERAQ